MPVSELRRAAARANGAKSRGPKTPEGKSKSACNSRKHGFYANNAFGRFFVAPENPRLRPVAQTGAQPEYVWREAHKRLERDPRETALLDTMARARAHLRSLLTAEVEIVNAEIRRQRLLTPELSPLQLMSGAFRVLCDKSNILDLLDRHIAKSDRLYNDAEAAWDRYRAGRHAEIQQENHAEITRNQVEMASNQAPIASPETSQVPVATPFNPPAAPESGQNTNLTERTQGAMTAVSVVDGERSAPPPPLRPIPCRANPVHGDSLGREMSTRRDFILQSAATAALATTQPTQLNAAQQPKAQEPKDWYGRPMRWMQLAFVEDDPGNYDPAFWLDYFHRVHADAACLSAGGCVAFYPTKVPFHYRSKFLGNRDAFGEMAAGCRKLGMNVIARTDPHAAHQDACDAHPEWIAVDENGNKRRHWADPDLWVTCALGGYNFEFMTDVTIEIVRDYKIDGIFSNRWSGSGMCYCKSCQYLFHAYSGRDLPRTANVQDPTRRQYILWREQRLFDLWRLWDTEIKKINPEAAFLANSGGGALSTLDMKTIGDLAPTLFADRQARHGLMPPWSNGKNGKEYAATMGSKAIAGIVSVGLEEAYRWKDSVQNADEIRLWMADGVAHNLRPWVTKFNAKPIDRRWFAPVEAFYNWHYRNEKYLRNEKSLAEVAIVFSQQTAEFYGGARAQATVEDHALGYYEALVEARVPFDMVHDQLLDEDHLARYRTLILPNIAALSDRQCHQLTEYVEKGGSLIATYETSLYDEWGVRRKDFGLAPLFGASFDGKIDTQLHNSYLNVEKDPSTGTFHPLVRGLENATRIVNGVNWVHVRPTSAGGHPPLTLVPSYPDLPMEEVYTRVARTDTPGVFARDVGKGRVVYFPFDIDRTFWEVLATDHGTVLKNAVAWAFQGNQRVTQPLTVTGKGMIDVSLWAQTGSLTAHLVNLTNPMMMKGPVRELIPSPPQVVSIRIPAGKRVAGVRFLVSAARPHYRENSGHIVVDVPSIELHEAVALDLA